MTQTPDALSLTLSAGEDTLAAHAFDLLRTAAVRVTAPRRLLLELLLQAERPLSAETLHERALARGAAMNLSTVYRNLQGFCTWELATESLQADGLRAYTIYRADSRPQMMCLDCGNSVALEAEVRQMLNDLVARHGFAADSLRLNLAAHCSNAAHCTER